MSPTESKVINYKDLGVEAGPDETAVLFKEPIINNPSNVFRDTLNRLCSGPVQKKAAGIFVDEKGLAWSTTLVNHGLLCKAVGIPLGTYTARFEILSNPAEGQPTAINVMALTRKRAKAMVRFFIKSGVNPSYYMNAVIVDSFRTSHSKLLGEVASGPLGVIAKKYGLES